MTATDMAAAVGRECLVTAHIGFSDRITIPARITDARTNFGRVDYRITPVGGSGETWVSSERVTFSAREE